LDVRLNQCRRAQIANDSAQIANDRDWQQACVKHSSRVLSVRTQRALPVRKHA